MIEKELGFSIDELIVRLKRIELQLNVIESNTKTILQKLDE